MTTKAIEARKAYKKQWQQNNPEKVRRYQERYWEKKAAQAQEDSKGSTDASRSDKEGAKA